MRRLLSGGVAVLVVLAVAPTGRADDKDVRALLDEAIKAHGGAKKLEKYRAATMELKGKVTVMNQKVDFTGESSMQLPDRTRSELSVEIMGMTLKVIEVLNKDKGWISVDGKTMALTKEIMAEAREQMHAGTVAGQLTPLKNQEYKLSPLGEAKVGGRDAVGIRVERKGYRDLSLFFDKKSHLLVKSERRAKDLAGGDDKEFTEETFYKDYKKVDGVQVPHRVVQKRDGKDYLEAEVSGVKIVEKLDDNTFAKP